MAASTIAEVERSLEGARAEAARTVERAREQARLLEAEGRADAEAAGRRRLAELRSLRAAVADDIERIESRTAALVELAAATADALAALARTGAPEPPPWGGLSGTIAARLGKSS